MKGNKILVTLIILVILLSTMMVFKKFDVNIVKQTGATIGVDDWQNTSGGYDILNITTEDLYYNNKVDLKFNGSLINGSTGDCRLYKPSYHTEYDSGSGLYEVWVNWTRLGGVISPTEHEPTLTDVNLTVSGLWLVCGDNPPSLYQVNMSDMQIYDISDGTWEKIVGWFWVNSSEWTVELSKNSVYYDKNETLTITVKKGGSTVKSTGWIDIWNMSGSNPTLVYHKELTIAMEGVWMISGTLMYYLTHDAGPGIYRVSAYEDIDPDHDEAEDIYGLEGGSSEDGVMGFNATFGDVVDWAGRFIDSGITTVIRDWMGAQVDTADWSATTYRWDSCGPFDQPEYWADYENFTVITFIYVDDDFNESTPGWNSTHFDNIQDGVNASGENGIVYVYNGTYYEEVDIKKYGIALIGESKDSTIIDAVGHGDAIDIVPDRVSICEFSVQNSGSASTDAGIEIQSAFCTISNNIISNNTLGIQGYHCNNNNITGNIIKSNSGDGIWFDSSSNNIISDNIVSSNNDDGIHLSGGSNNNIIFRNTINFTSPGTAIAIYGDNNLVYHNNLIDNVQNAGDDPQSNIWDNGYPSGGNYWDDYTGNDEFSGPEQNIPGPDGIGDTPYILPHGYNQDNYPLMHHFELYYILNISAPSEVNEGELFNVVVTSLGGPVVPDALVGFNNEIIRTDENGRVFFTAPLVDEDTYYDIIAVKGEHYSIAYETILVKDIPDEFEKALIIGFINNLSVPGEVILFNAVNIRIIKFSPFQILAYKSGELISIEKDYFGLVGARFIFALCDVYVG
jgi:parallel beta-helix repeat protein